MPGILHNLAEVWNRTSLMQRVLLVAVGLVLVGGVVLLVSWARKPDMALLYSRLSADDAGKIVEKVRDAGVRYELKDGGTTVLVPQGQVYSLRLSLASEGLPVGDQKGYEILDRQDFGASPFQLEVGYVRAVEGELAKSIQLIEGVASARVHIVRPRSRIFASEDKDASATVVVKMRGGRRLNASNVSAVVHLVAGGVEGLRPDKVVVVDAQGNLYTGEQGEEGVARPSKLHDYKGQLEAELARKAEDLLALALGPDRAMVRVCVSIERSELEETKETFDKQNQVPVREETTEKVTAAPDKAKTPGNKETSATFEYMTPKTTSRRRDWPGKITSKTVSAVVDLSRPEGAEAAGKTLTLADCEEIIKNAVGGLDEKDKLTVKETTFSKASPAGAPEDEGGGMFTKEFLLEIVRRGSLGLLVIGALLALRILAGQKKKASGAAAALPGGSGGQSENLLPVTPSGEVDPEALRARITHALQENPEEVKRLFLSWVGNEKGGA